MSLPAPGPPPEAGRLLRAILGATFFIRFGFGITIAVFASYIVGRSAGLDAEAVGLVGLLSALAPIGEFSTVMFSGVAADRWGRIPVLLTGLAAAGALMAAAATTRNPWLLGACNFAFGMSSGAILAASLAVVADRAASDQRGYEMGRFDAMNLLGWILGFATGFALLGLLANPDLYLAFVLAAGLLGGGWAVARLLSAGTSEAARSASLRFAVVFRAALRREVLVVTLPWMVIYMLLGTVFVFLGTAATGAGLDSARLAALIGGGGLILLATQPYFGRLADRFGRLRLMTVGTAGFVGVLVNAALLQSQGPTPLLLATTGISALAALAYGPAALAALADLARALSRATTMAVYSLTISLGMLLGLLASTQLYRWMGPLGLDLFFGILAVGLVGLTFIRYLDVRRERQGGSLPASGLRLENQVP